MKRKLFGYLFIIALAFTIGFTGINNVEASVSGKFINRLSSTNYQVQIGNTKYDGYCMTRGVDHPPKNSKVTCSRYATKGAVLWVMDQKHTYTTQNAVWELVSKGSKTTAGKNLAKTAKSKHSSYTNVPSINSVTTPKMTKNGNYYTSQTIKVSTSNIKSWSVSYTGAPSGTKTINKKSNSFQIQVPVASVTKTLTFTVKVTAAKTCYNTVYKCHYSKSNRQDIGIVYKDCKTPSTTKKVEVKYNYCHVEGSNFYGEKGTIVSKEDFAKQCGEACTKDSKTGLYLDINKNIVKTEQEMNKSCFSCSKPSKDGTLFDNDGKSYGKTVTAEWLKACHPCGTYNGKFIGPNGEIYNTKEEQNQACVGTCKVENGKYYDSTGKEVPTEKDMNKSCYSCEKPRSDGQLFDNDGNAINEEQHKERCNPKCSADAKGQYYDINHNPVSYEEYKHSCFPQTPIPEPSKSVDTEFVRYEKNYHYTIKHEVPYRTAIDYFKSYVFSDVLEEPLQVKSEDDVKIIQKNNANGQESNWTNKFTIKIEGQKVTATLKDTKDKNFYGTMDSNKKEYTKEYSFILTASLKDKAEQKFDMSKYKQGEDYIIPDIANISIVNQDGKTTSQDTNKVEVMYTIPTPPTKIVDKVDQTASYEKGTKYSYTISKQVPKYTGNQKYKSFVFKDTFEEPINISSPSSLIIKNDGGVDVTNWFTIKVSGQTLSATLKDNYNNDDFYGHTYEFFATVNLKQSYNLKKYKKGKQYVIPNYATFTIDGNEVVKTNIVDVIVSSKVVPKVIIPNTASPLQIAAIAAGIAIIISGIYAILEKYGLVKTLSPNKETDLKQVNEVATKPIEKPEVKKESDKKKTTPRNTTKKQNTTKKSSSTKKSKE